MPTPYYDANDGWPAHLLLNDGSGNFSDANEQNLKINSIGNNQEANNVKKEF